MPDPTTTRGREPIAIIGMGCRFPGGVDSPAALWRLLRDGVDAISEIPADRFPAETFYDPRPGLVGRISTRFGGFLGDLRHFDADFFGIAPHEAERLDPQQRLLLETSWEAMEAAGQVPARLRDSNTGVFVGLWVSDYEARLFREPSGIDFHMTTGTGRYSAAGRLSHLFGWHGPSFALDCACSSSLVAVHLGCASLRAGECDLAVAGGANVMLEPSITVAYSQARMMAPDGRCKFGDARADGYVRSEGVGVVLLKRLSDALADGDPIAAVIRGSAVNNDGDPTGPLGRPARAGHRDLLTKACRDAAVNPAEVDYVEAHGTGTRAGDPVEIEALADVLGVGRVASSPLLLGSIKTNIGHAEAAAGIAGLMKAVLALEHRWLPRSLHFETPNPYIPWERLPVEIVREGRAWAATTHPRRAGVNSFGIAGTNAHVILEEAPERPTQGGASATRADLLLISGRTETALRRSAEAHRDWLAPADAAGIVPRDVAWTSKARRSHHEHRLAVVGRSMDEWREHLDTWLAAGSGPSRVSGTHEGPPRKLAFVFSGHGGQWAGMGRRLLARSAGFRQAIDACEAAFRPHVEWSLARILEHGEETRELADMSISQPALFAVEYGLAAVWAELGVRPDAVVGHSVGEIAAAAVAGALSLEDAAHVVCRRSALMREVSGRGAMAVVDLSFADAQAVIRGREAQLAVAVSNSSRSSVLSGDPAAIDAIMAELEQREVFCRRVKVDVAGHSAHMDPLVPRLVATLSSIAPRGPSVPWMSSVLASWMQGQAADATYWGGNLRQPVRFAAAVGALLAEGVDAFIEIGPHPVQLPPIQQEMAILGRTGIAIGTLRRDLDDEQCVADALGAAYVGGVAIDWSIEPCARVVPELPTYPFQRERHWIDVADRPASAGTALDRPSPQSDPARHLPGYRVEWEPIQPPRKPAPAPRRWLMCGQVSDAGRTLASCLEKQGDRVSWSTGIDGRQLAEPGPTAVVFLASPCEAGLEAAASDADRFIALVQTLVRTRPGGALPRVWLVTADAVAATPLDVLSNPFSGLLHGAARVIASEHPRLRCSMLDLSASPDTEELATAASRLAEDPDERELACRGREWFAARIIEGITHSSERVDGLSSDGRPVQVRLVGTDGDERWVFAAAPDVAPGPGEVQVAVVAASPNRRPCAGVAAPGGGVAGVVTRVGEQVSSVAPGDAVLSLALDGLGSSMTVDAAFVARLPESASVDQAAAVVLPHVATHVAFTEIARLRAGDRVHLAGLGPLFDTVARAAAARAGSVLMAEENGDEVDVLLARDASTGSGALERLTPGGRYLTLEPPRVALSPAVADPVLPSNIMCSSVDLPALARRRPLVISEALADCAAQLRPQEPFPGVRTVGAADIPAVWSATDGSSAERLVVTLEGAAIDASALSAGRLAGGSYLVTGGLGALGLLTARWLAEHGARRLFLVGRRPASPEALRMIDAIKAVGAEVQVRQVDVSERDAVRALLAEIDTGGAPLVGIVHAAGVLDDGTVMDMTPERFRHALQAKAGGAWHLHELTADRPLTLFVLFSSIVPLFGLAGQVNYAAANAFLDALALHRRRRGRAATSIGWGPWADVGLAAAGGQRGARLSDRGFPSLSPQKALARLGSLLEVAPPCAAIADVDWQAFASAYPHVVSWPLFAHVRPAGAGGNATDGSTSVFLAAARQVGPGPSRDRFIETHLQALTARVLGVAPARIGLQRPLRTLGLDSLIGLELRNLLERDFGVPIPATLVWNFPTVTALAGELAKRAGLIDTRPATVAAPPEAGEAGDDALLAMLEELEDMSETDAQQALGREDGNDAA